MDVRNLDDIKPFVTKDGSIIKEIFRPDNSDFVGGGVAHATIPVGEKSVTHIHKKSQEIYYILRGSGIISIEDESRAVNPGDSIFIQPQSAHNIRNAGKEDLELLCFSIPEYTHEDTVLKE